MSDKHIIQRFDFETICAGILRVIDNKSLYVKYKKYLDSEWFFYNDSSEQVKSLRDIIKLLHTAHLDKKNENTTVEWMRSYIPTKYLGEEVGDKLQRIFSSWLSNEIIRKKMADDACFMHFVNYLKVIVIARDSKLFYDSYQKGDPDKAAAQIQSVLTDISTIGKSDSEVLDPMTILDDIMRSADKKHQQVLYLGCDGMDSQIGGFEKQTLTMFIALTNSGKTMLAHHLIRQCIKMRVPAFVACVEDRRDSFIRKAVSCNTGIPMSSLKRPKDLTPQEVELIKKFMVDFNEFIRVEFIYGESVDACHKAALEYDAELTIQNKLNKIPVVNIVDYSGHIAGQSGGDKMYEKMRTAYAARKDYALKHNKICFDFAQVNREGGKRNQENHYLSQTDLAGAFDIAQVCDNIISLNRNASNITNQECVLSLTKCRDGAVGVKVQVKTDFAKARYDMEQWDIIDAPSNVRDELQALRDTKQTNGQF